MRFLARFASAPDLECFRIDELRAVCSMLGVRNWRIEGISSEGDALDVLKSGCGGGSNGLVSSSALSSSPSSSFNTADGNPALLVDALTLDAEAAAEAKANAEKQVAEQPLGNYNNFYCTANPNAAAKGSTAAAAPLNMNTEMRQPLNFAIIHLDSIADAVAVAKRCVTLKGFSLLFGTAATVEGLLEKIQQRVAYEQEGLAKGTITAVGDVEGSEANMFLHPKDRVESTDAAVVTSIKNEAKVVKVFKNGGSTASSSSSSSSYTPAEGDDALLVPLLAKEYNFKYHVDGVCYTAAGPYKLDAIKQFAAIPHMGAVSMMDYHMLFEVSVLYKAQLFNPKAKERVVPPILGAAFSVPVAVAGRTLILERYALNRRPYIGTTSMPPELTFLMANLARVRSGDICYDPFCGTCSSLITCAHHGGIAYGSDIDGQAMRGGSVKFRASKQVIQQQQVAMKNYLPACLVENGGPITAEEAQSPTVYTNFKVYGLQPPERLRYDFSLWVTLFDQLDGAYTDAKRKALTGTSAAAIEGSAAETQTASPRQEVIGAKRPRDASKPFLFDAILSDPPYGIREQKSQTTTNDKADDADTIAAKKKERRAAKKRAAAEAAGTAGGEGEGAAADGDNAADDSGDVTTPPPAPALHTPAPNSAVAREDYDISTMIVDLIRFAGVHLAVGKRIVFWHPTTYHYTHDELPRHPFLRIILARPQMLSLKLVRVLVVMERVAEPWFPLPAGVTGPCDVTKAVLFPQQKTASLRELMDATDLGDNEAYNMYKKKVEEKREAVRSYWRQQGGGEELKEGERPQNPAHAGMSKRQLSKQKALISLENREKKLNNRDAHNNNITAKNSGAEGGTSPAADAAE